MPSGTLSAVATAPGLPESVRRLLPGFAADRVWLVGGSVRDGFLGRPTSDFDFVFQGDALALGRRLANELGADYYDLDPQRGAGRLILTTGEGQRSVLDFSALRGPDIDEDLRRRDFTVNAMAIPFGMAGLATDLVDPLHGARDLQQKVLRACSATSIGDDPIRAVRAARLSAELGLRLETETIHQVRQASTALAGVSPERLRDELFRLLGTAPGTGLRLLDHLGLVDSTLPEISPLRGLGQPPPHAFDAFEHTLATVEHLDHLLRLLAGRAGKSAATDLTEAEALHRLSDFRDDLTAYLDFSPSFGRPRAALLLWSALLHDSGKPQSRATDAEGRLRFFGHETIGARVAVEASRRLRLSTVEQAEVEMTVLHHMRPEWLEAEAAPSARAVYRFFRAAESAGVSVVLLSLADLLGRFVPPAPQDAWRRRLESARTLLQAWFSERSLRVAPAMLLSGEEVMELRGILPGPDVGKILEALREAQAAGEVGTREEAERFVADYEAAS